MGMKKAFTFAEMMIVFVIIGTIIALGVSSVKPWEKSYKYSYHRMYNALALSIYNHMVNTTEDDAFPKNASTACEALLEFMNTTEHLKDAAAIKTYCNGRFISGNPDFINKNYDTKVIRPTNGTKLWVGAKTGNGAPYELKVSQGGITDTVRYYIIYVDLNGDRKPNTSKWTRDQMADIVAFIMTDKYNIIPVGYPEIDSRYLEAHVVYPSFDSTGEEDTAGDDYETSDAITYYEARVNAYDLNNDGNIDTVINNIYTYDFNSELNNNSDFKVKHTDGTYKVDKKENYNSHYETAPVFDENKCNSTGYDEPVCNVKIHDFH